MAGPAPWIRSAQAQSLLPGPGAHLERSGVSRPAREPLDVNVARVIGRNRFWPRGNTLSQRCRAAHAAPIFWN
jgi:hypothetical protein